MVFKTVIPLKLKNNTNVILYALLCGPYNHVILNCMISICLLMTVGSVKVCLCLLLYYDTINNACIYYSFFSAWFLDIRVYQLVFSEVCNCCAHQGQ